MNKRMLRLTPIVRKRFDRLRKGVNESKFLTNIFDIIEGEELVKAATEKAKTLISRAQALLSSVEAVGLAEGKTKSVRIALKSLSEAFAAKEEKGFETLGAPSDKMASILPDIEAEVSQKITEAEEKAFEDKVKAEYDAEIKARVEAEKKTIADNKKKLKFFLETNAERVKNNEARLAEINSVTARVEKGELSVDEAEAMIAPKKAKVQKEPTTSEGE